MKTGAPLVLDQTVSPTLLKSVPAIQALLMSWNKDLTVTTVTARTYVPSVQGKGRGLFFSGGVDSFYSLLVHRDHLTHLIMIEGFGRSEGWERVEAMARTVAEEEGLRLVTVKTNAAQAVAGLPWLELGHGAVLASVGLLLQETLQSVIIGSSKSQTNLAPMGTHPDLDPLWSTERLTFIHDSLVPRLKKTAMIADYPLAMKWLRVCWQRPDLYNCGSCEKCLRTQIGLELAGAGGKCTTLPRTLDLRRVAAIRHHERSMKRALTLLDAAESAGHRRLATALRASIWRSKLLNRIKRLIRH